MDVIGTDCSVYKTAYILVEFFEAITQRDNVVGYQLLEGPLPPSSLHPHDGGSMVLRNVGVLPHQYTASRPESSPP